MLPLSPDDTFAFWQGLKDSGLLEEVIHEFHQELVETMKGLQQRAQDPPLQLGGKDLDMGGQSSWERGLWIFLSLGISGWHNRDVVHHKLSHFWLIDEAALGDNLGDLSSPLPHAWDFLSAGSGSGQMLGLGTEVEFRPLE